VKEAVEKLLRVQEVDTRILAIRARLEKGPREIQGEDQILDAHRKRHDELTRQAKEAMRAGERKNGELETLDEKRKQLTGKLMTARSNKEYDALKLEIAGISADFELLEEEALQQWSIGEERESEAEEEAGKIAELERQGEVRKKEWEVRAAELAGELEGLEADRAERAKLVPESWLRMYERVLEHSGAPAIVEVVERYCQGCQMQITVHDVTRALAGNEVVTCRACNRILYAETL
jgi:predicted  nucleic acid-binding Zn-ribbon protein